MTRTIKATDRRKWQRCQRDLRAARKARCDVRRMRTLTPSIKACPEYA